MDLNQYVKDCTRTESIVDKITTSPDILVNALIAFIAAGNILDQIKKNAFYKKEIDRVKFIDNINKLNSSSADLVSLGFERSLGQIIPEEQLNINTRVFHAIIGIMTESTELGEALVKHLYSDGELDTVNLLEEISDLFWYQAICIDSLNSDFETVMNTNIKKLKARFPDKFTSDKAIDRNIDAERQILETGFSSG